jgi:small subunit ribosomal protein S16
MAVHIRLSRAGAKKRPFYRLVVTDHRSPRGGRFLENLGTYDPSKDPGLLVVNGERLEYWRKHGATPSETVERLLKRQAKLNAPFDVKGDGDAKVDAKTSAAAAK